MRLQCYGCSALHQSPRMSLGSGGRGRECAMATIASSSGLSSPLSREEPLPLPALSFSPFPLLPLASCGWTWWGEESVSSCAWLHEVCLLTAFDERSILAGGMCVGGGALSLAGAGITTLCRVCLLCSAARGLRLREKHAHPHQPMSEQTLNSPLTLAPAPSSHQLPFQPAYLLH